jgi:hypothetical protein
VAVSCPSQAVVASSQQLGQQQSASHQDQQTRGVGEGSKGISIGWLVDREDGRREVGDLPVFLGYGDSLNLVSLASPGHPHPLPGAGMGGSTCCVRATSLTRNYYDRKERVGMMRDKLVSQILEIFSQNIGGLK